jgi:hypothetical protein
MPEHRAVWAALPYLLTSVVVGCAADEPFQPGLAGDPPLPIPQDSVDITAPAIFYHMPPSGAIGVGIGASVAVDFTEVLNANTVTTSSFTLTSPTGLLPGTIVVKDFSAEFKPDQLLIEFATEYSWTLTTALRDTAGHSFAANYTATFTTVLADGLYYYRITNQQIGDTLSLEIPSSGTSCVMASTAESASQWWRLIETATPGEYVMVSRATGAPRLLDGGDGMTPCYVGTQGQVAGPFDGQRWTLTPAGVPHYRLQNLDFGPARSLDLDASGAPIMAVTATVASQLWKLERLGRIN